MNVHNIICNSPSYIYSQYKIIEYFLGMYNTYLNIIDEINDVPIAKATHLLMPQQDDY